MKEDDIAEDPRGIAPDQHLDPYIVPVLEEKLKEFGDKGTAYKKKSADMKTLTAIEKKQKLSEELSTDEIRFLYQSNSPIEGFGYGSDPRIEEIISQRDIKKDASIQASFFPSRPVSRFRNTKYANRLDEKRSFHPLLSKGYWLQLCN